MLEIPDIPNNYKAMLDLAINDLMDAAETIKSIMDETGNKPEFTVYNESCFVTIRETTDDEVSSLERSNHHGSSHRD